MFDKLPRELQLLVFKKLDMDARINHGIIRKLAVPALLQLRISNCVQNALRHHPKNTNCCVSLHFSPGKYYTCFFDTSEHITYWYFTDISCMRRRQKASLQNDYLSFRKNIYKMK